MKYKLIAVDFDDTLARSDLSVSEHTKNLIKEYEKAGGRFMLATGRAPRSAVDICRNNGIGGYAVCFQGAEVVDVATEEPIFKAVLAPEVSSKICRYIQEKGWYCHIFQGDSFIADKVTDFGTEYEREAGLKRKVVNMPLDKYILANNIHTGKVLLIDDPNKTLGEVDDIVEHFGDVCNSFISKPHLVEIAPKEVSKAKGVAKVAEKLGIKQEEVICVGDSYNDITMIEWAGLGVAVGNAWDAVKDAADVTVATNENDGVAEVIEKYGLGVAYED